jgi:hypothetical protein
MAAGARCRDVADFQPGVCIATFDANGTYGNHEDGSSHAAFLLARTPDGLEVSDQWAGQPVHAPDPLQAARGWRATTATLSISSKPTSLLPNRRT